MKTKQNQTLEAIVRDYEARPAQGNSVADMVRRTEYLLAKKMLEQPQTPRTEAEAPCKN
ncbi:hypothetical protein RAE19_04235 [Rhodoferax sp. TBRC 17660]|uniref:Uncharacterized protein n=1 Tax=Rhodoferax potami TaxID=3068338 RepID=A0ABU3KKI7_9BURK|nr:hypothetical protein [Rhodoferax sp. TBRC 17660]MDT7517953.1 hypothetical protein [Rhodoferax sp. TBRC 17660]